jgi:thiol-disulfide isomerase/thioredoxin
MRKYAVYFLLAAGLIFLANQVRNYYHNPELPLGKTRFFREDGSEWFMEKPSGKYLLISCFQSWCRDCIKEAPSIAALQKSIGKDRLEIVLVSDEDASKVQRFGELIQQEMPLFRSEKSFSELGIRVYPSTWLLRPDRKIILTKTEGYNWDSPEVHALIP